MHMGDMERLAVATALERACRSVTDPRPRSGETLRTRVDDGLRALYERTGCDRVRVSVAGAEVGTLSLSMTKPRSGVEMRVDDDRKLVEWLRATDEGRDVLGLVALDAKVQSAIVAAAADYGFLPDGCRMVEVDEPARIKGTVLRVDPAKVASALGDGLPQAVAGLLGGGHEQ